MDTERNVECLHWDGYRANLQTMVTHQLDRGLFCDITIVCEGGDTVKVHRIVLSTCSAFLNEIIADLPPYKEAAFILKDWKFRDVKLIVEFMYSGEICVERVSLLLLLFCCHKHNLDSFAVLCIFCVSRSSLFQLIFCVCFFFLFRFPNLESLTLGSGIGYYFTN